MTGLARLATLIAVTFLVIIAHPVKATDYLSSDAPLGRFHGVLRLTHTGQDPKTFNSWISNDYTSSFYASILFEGLFTPDPDTDEPLPRLAKSYSVAKGGKEIIVVMRKGLTWTDGHPITADDVIYTWNTLIRDGVAQSSLKDILLVDGKFPQVSKIDDYTIKFETQDVFAPFLKNLGIAIAPKHDIEKFFLKRKARTLNEKQLAFNQYLGVDTKPAAMVTSGAFKLLRLKSGERIEFERNPNYYIVNKANQRLPYLDKIVFTYVQDDSADTFKFLAGESYQLKVSPNNAALLKSLEKKYKFKLYDLGPSSGTNFIWFNMSPSLPQPQRSWFNNTEFRTAISYAVDRDSMVANVFQGLAAPLFTAESLQSPFVDTQFHHKRDLKRARALLAGAGFKLKSQAGSKPILYDAQGHKVEFSLYTNAGNREREMMASIIAANLEEIGISLYVKTLEFNNLVARISAGKNYEMGLIGLTGSSEPNGGANVWRSDGRLHMFDQRGEVTSPVRSWEAQVDKLFSRGVRTLDMTQRKAVYSEFQKIIYQENPVIYLVSPRILEAGSLKLGNARPTRFQGILPFLYEVYLKNP